MDALTLALITATATSSLTLIAGLISQQFIHWRTLEREQIKMLREQQLLSFRELMGLKITLSSWAQLQYEAVIFATQHERLWQLRGGAPDSFDLKQAELWQAKVAEYAPEMIKSMERVFAALGTVTMAYPMVDETIWLIDRVYNMKMLVVPEPEPDLDATRLQQWREATWASLRERIEAEMTRPVGDLVEHLRDKEPWQSTPREAGAPLVLQRRRGMQPPAARE